MQIFKVLGAATISLGITITASASSVRSAEFRTIQQCLTGIKNDSQQTLEIIRDTPEIVTGNLKNGKTFACEKTVTGSKGTYYKGWYMTD